MWNDVIQAIKNIKLDTIKCLNCGIVYPHMVVHVCPSNMHMIRCSVCKGKYREDYIHMCPETATPEEITVLDTTGNLKAGDRLSGAGPLAGKTIRIIDTNSEPYTHRIIHGYDGTVYIVRRDDPQVGLDMYHRYRDVIKEQLMVCAKCKETVSASDPHVCFQREPASTEIVQPLHIELP